MRRSPASGARSTGWRGYARYSAVAVRFLVLALLATLLPAVAFAQSPARDIAYCNRLADLYERYIGRSDIAPIRPNPGGGLEADVAAAQCRQGKPSGIPVLERVLRGNGFTLPPRG
jgi:hypothetical protein